MSEIHTIDMDTLTASECFDMAESIGDASTLYATGAQKRVAGHMDANGVIDVDALARRVADEINDRYPVASCTKNSDKLKQVNSYQKAVKRAGLDAYNEQFEDCDADTVMPFQEVSISFGVTGKKTDKASRKRTVTAENITAIQATVLADIAEDTANLKAEQKAETDKLKAEQAAKLRGLAPVADILADVRAYLVDQYGTGRERELLAAWLADLNKDMENQTEAEQVAEDRLLALQEKMSA